MFEVKTRELAGRIGRLVTLHGTLETPFLFPVVDPLRQVIKLSEIERIGFNGIITNAYLFYKRNKGLVKNIHNELSWSKVIMTDSGGYQILVYGNIEIDNKTIVTYEKNIGSDISVILDIPTGTKMTRSSAEKAVYETYKRGIEALPLIMDSDQLWVYPVQGAPYLELLKRSAILASKLPYDIYAVGSPTVILEKYKYSKLVKLVLLTRLLLPQNKPIHVFGVGHPMIIPFLIAVGGDFFDSASYILYARDNRYMTETGTRDIRELEYFPCNCPICSRVNPREILELPWNERIKLIALHNLYTLIKEINTTKQYMKEGRLWELLEYRSKAHPSLREAFEVIKKHAGILEKYTSRTKPSGKAILLPDYDSAFNPKIRENTRRAFNLILTSIKDKIIILVPAYQRPYKNQLEYKEIIEKTSEINDVEVLFIHPLLGIFHPDLSSTYPFYQHVSRITKSTINSDKLVSWILMIARKSTKRIILIKTGWLSEKIVNELRDKLEHANLNITTCTLSEFSSQILQ